LRSFSSWGMYRLSNADITTALEGVASNGFNGVTVWMGGGYRLNSSWQVSSSYYKNAAGASFWSGTPWASSLGSGWSTYDQIVAEAARLGIAVSLSLPVAFGSTGARADMEAVTNTDMYNAGVAVATRYASASNILWHVMIDDTGGPGSTIGARIEAFYDGVNDTESPARPVRWMEVNNGSSTNEQGWLNTTQFAVPINCMYEYGSNSVELFEAAYTESGTTSGPAGDCEPPYDGSPHYSGNLGQQLRERSSAVFIEGGSVINYGQENWWVFGATGLYDESLTWQDVPTHDHTVQQSYIWDVVDAYMLHTDWAPTSGFVTTGEGSGDTKAAQGAYARAAIAYFPSSRTVAVDTTILTGISHVRLRWYNPQDGTYTSIAASEAQQSGRSISYPSAHADTTNDWLLVVDLDPTDGTAATTLQNVTCAASGTSGLVITGSSAVTLANFTAAASGTETITGTSATTLQNFTSSATGTETITGTASSTLANFTSSATGAEVFTGTAASTLANFTGAASGWTTVTGTSAQTLQNVTSTATGTETITGTAAPTLANVVGAAAGWTTATGTSAQTLQNFTSSASGTETITGSSAQTLQHFASTASGWATVTGTSAQTLANCTSTASGSVTNPGSNGAAVLADFTSTASGSVIITGTAASALAPVTSTATGSETITGTAASTLGSFTSSAVGTESIVGTGASTLATVTVAATGALLIQAVAATTLAAFTANATGSSTTSVTGTVAVTLAPVTAAAQGSAPVTGSGVVTLADFISTAAGVATGGPSALIGFWGIRIG